jgi:hypothetical protein
VTPALSVDAELVVERSGRTFRVWSEGDDLVVGAPSLSALRELDDLRSVLPMGLDRLGDGLDESGLTVEIQVRRATVARAGEGVDGDALGRRLAGFDAAVDPVGIATAAVRALG